MAKFSAKSLYFREIYYRARQLHELRRMDECRNNTQPYFAEQMMNATNKSECVSWSQRVPTAIRQRRISVAMSTGALAMIGFALLPSTEAIPVGAKKTKVLVPVSASTPSTLLKVPNHQAIRSMALQPQASTKSASLDGELESIRDVVLDGVEFAAAGAEVTNQFGPYRQIGNTVSWFAQELGQP